jgi:hypothetical protein
MSELSEAEREAVARSPDVPARVADPVTQQAFVLLRADDFDWVRGLLQDEPEVPRRRDPRTGTVYAVLPEGRYERFKAFFEEDPLTEAEKQALLREAGRRAGWDGPAWDRPESS